MTDSEAARGGECSAGPDIEAAKDAYCRLLKAYYLERSEAHLLATEELGRDLVRLNVPPEEVGEIHEQALQTLIRDVPGLDPRNLASPTSDVLTTMLMAYGLAYRERAARLAARDKAVEERDERIRSLAENIPGVVYQRILHPDGSTTYPYLSAGVEELLGYTVEEVMANPSIFANTEFAEDQANHYESLRQSAGTLSPWFWQGRMRAKNGTVRWLELSGRPRRLGDGRTLWDCVLLDVTARKEAEAKAREDQAQLRGIMDNVADGIVTIDEAGRIESFNPAAAKMFGYKAPEVIGRNVSMLMPEPDRAQHDGYLRNYLRTGESKIIGVGPRDVLARRKDGSRFPIALTVGEMTVGGKRFFVGALRDATERKQAEEALRRSEAEATTARRQLIDAIENIPEGFALFDNEDRLVLWNGRYREIFRFDESVLTPGIQFRDMLLHALGRGLVADAKGQEEEWLAERLRRRANPSTQIERQLSSGRWVLIGERRTGDGGTVSITADVTGIKQRERDLAEKSMQLEAVLESMDEGISLLDADMNLVLFNRRYRELLDLPPGRFRPGQPVEELIEFMAERGHYGEGVAEEIVRTRMALLKSDFGRVFERRREDGTVLEVRRNPAPDGGTVTTFTDITKRKKEEEERQALSAQLLEAQKMEAVGALAGGIAHDFNNILGIILGFGQLAQRSLSDPRLAREHLDKVLGAAQRAKALVARILAFSRHDEAERRPVRLDEALSEAVEFLRASLPSTIRVRQQVACEAPTVMADPTRIEQVILNLATNAAQAMPDGGELNFLIDEVDIGKTPVATRTKLAPGAYTRLTVIDTGHGIDEATLARLFEPFFTTKGRGHGTGLGLSTVHGIVTDCGGAIEVQSTPGKGTTFRVYLPSSAAVATAEAGADAPIPTGGGETVMVIDDEPEIVEWAERTLGRLGYRTVGFTDSRAAVAAFRARPQAFDAVITDLTMPGKNGIEVAGEISGARPGIPIVLSSGFAGTVAAKKMEQAGILEILRKPTGEREMAECLSRVLRQPQPKRPGGPRSPPQ